MLKIMSCCGSGASSGSMAQNTKKAARKKGTEIDVTARNESLIESFLVGTDTVLIAPHLITESELIRKRCQGMPAIIIDRRSYGMLDGDAVLTQLLDALE